MYIIWDIRMSQVDGGDSEDVPKKSVGISKKLSHEKEQ